jgi:c-di-GMP-binding flagellar brake protein YcgR
MAEAQITAQGSVSRVLTERPAIERAFRLFRDQRSAISLRFDGEAQSYSARVLDARETHFLLEDIRPRDGLRLLHRAAPFALTARTDGLYAYGEGLRVAEVADERGVPYFIVPYPPRLLTQQRRRAARFRLPISVAANGSLARLTRKSGPIEGEVIDISTGGCRIAFDKTIEPALAIDEPIDKCEIAVSNLLSLTAVAVVRHQATDPETNQIQCGIEFLKMSVRDRRRLEQFIQAISRLSA